MRDIIIALIDYCGSQSLAQNALAVHIGALETLIKRHRLLDDGELQRQLLAEQQKRQADSRQVSEMLARLRELVTKMQN